MTARILDVLKSAHPHFTDGRQSASWRILELSSYHSGNTTKTHTYVKA